MSGGRDDEAWFGDRLPGGPLPGGGGRRWATYLHGLFDDDAFRRAWLDHVRRDAGLEPQGRQLVRCDLEASLDRLADVVRQNVDLKAIYQRLGL